MADYTDIRVVDAHEVLAAVLHAGVGHDDQANPNGFKRATELGLIEGANPRTTFLGQALLRLAGVE